MYIYSQVYIHLSQLPWPKACLEAAFTRAMAWAMSGKKWKRGREEGDAKWVKNHLKAVWYQKVAAQSDVSLAGAAQASKHRQLDRTDDDDDLNKAIYSSQDYQAKCENLRWQKKKIVHLHYGWLSLDGEKEDRYLTPDEYRAAKDWLEEREAHDKAAGVRAAKDWLEERDDKASSPGASSSQGQGTSASDRKKRTRGTPSAPTVTPVGERESWTSSDEKSEPEPKKMPRKESWTVRSSRMLEAKPKWRARPKVQTQPIATDKAWEARMADETALENSMPPTPPWRVAKSVSDPSTPARLFPQTPKVRALERTLQRRARSAKSSMVKSFLVNNRVQPFVALIFEGEHCVPPEFDFDWTQHPNRKTEYKLREQRNVLIKEALKNGKKIAYRSSGNSMSPWVVSGDSCTFQPVVDAKLLRPHDVVFCQIQSPRVAYYAHIIKKMVPWKGGLKFTISNLEGHVNGTCTQEHIYGKLTHVQR